MVPNAQQSHRQFKIENTINFVVVEL